MNFTDQIVSIEQMIPLSGRDRSKESNRPEVREAQAKETAAKAKLELAKREWISPRMLVR